MAIPDIDAHLLQWRIDPYSLVQGDDTFGNVWYDAVAGLWRLYAHGGADASTGPVVRYESDNWAGPWGGRAVALANGEAGAWDELDCGVPFVWKEGGDRPWRMLYRGTNAADRSVIGLATSTDGLTFERKDTAGNPLTAEIIPFGTGADWDAGGGDFGGVFKVGDTYYLHYNTFSPRKTGLATSTDLVNWTKHPDNPLFSGMTDYDDSEHDGTPDLAQGYFCPDVVRWDRKDRTVRYVIFITHYTAGGLKASIDVFVSASPIFTKANRTYVGKAYESNVVPAHTVEGAPVNNCDVPAVVTDDISRDVLRSTRTGNVVPMLLSVSAQGWNQAWLIHDTSLHGAVLSNVCADLPVDNPVHKLAPTGPDANTIALWLPGQTRSMRDLSTTGTVHPMPKIQGIDATGALFVAAQSHYCRFKPGTGKTIDHVEAITGDFTLEATVTFASNYIAGSRGILYFGLGTGKHHFWFDVTGSAGPTYTLGFLTCVATANKTASVSLGAVVLDTPYRLAVCKTGGKIYFFKDGALLNAGGTAFDWTIDTQATASLWIGSFYNGTSGWDGYIDDIRISDAARWTANYTAAALTHVYKTPGYIYGRVDDFTAAGAGGISQTVVTPEGTTVAQKGRNAANGTDQSETDGDFTALTTSAPATRYQQYELVLSTTDTSETPTVEKMLPYQHELLEQREVKHGIDRGDGLKGRYRPFPGYL